MDMGFQNLSFPEIEEKEVTHVLACNDRTAAYCLTLKEEEARLLIADRKENLRDLELLELKEGILPRLVQTFADSPYVFQDSYAETLGSLQYLFYRFHRGSDEEMLEQMRQAYDNICQGSMELLTQYFENLEQEDRKKGKKTLDYLEPEDDFVDYTDGEYSFEELLAVLMKTVRLYMEDTSLTYNETRRLMSGITYSIRAGIQSGGFSLKAERPDAMLMYREGQKVLNRRFREVKEQTKQIFAIFCDYNCTFVYRSVFQGLQNNIRRQDIVRTPHLLAAELEYPVIGSLDGQEGVNKLLAYVHNIKTEWKFLSAFTVQAVEELLERIVPDYRESFYDNISETVLLQAFGCMAADREVLPLQLEAGDIETIRLYFHGDTVEMVQKELEKMLVRLFDEDGDWTYFQPACHRFAVRICNAILNDSLENVFGVMREGVSYGG